MKVAEVTGGAQGIGRAIAYEFARAGYGVSILDPVADAGREALPKIRALGGTGTFLAGDTGSEADIDAWLAKTASEFGCPDILINNAGITATSRSSSSASRSSTASSPSTYGARFCARRTPRGAWSNAGRVGPSST